MVPMPSLRDWAAIFIFGGSFLASILSEQLCGRYSEYCPVYWQPTTPEGSVHARYHCQPKSDNSLGDPALSVGSLQLAAALPYLEFDVDRFTVDFLDPSLLTLLPPTLSLACNTRCP